MKMKQKVNDSKKQKNIGNYIKNKKQKRVYYSFLTFVLVVCIIQMGISAFLNISKFISNQAKIKTMKSFKLEVISENKKLKNKFKDFNSLKSMEAIARNNLKMAGKDEVLVIINQSQKQIEKDENYNPKKQHKSLLKPRNKQ